MLRKESKAVLLAMLAAFCIWLVCTSSGTSSQVTSVKRDVHVVGQLSRRVHPAGHRALFISFATGLPQGSIVQLARALWYYAPAARLVLFVNTADREKLRTALHTRGVPDSFVELLNPGQTFEASPMWTQFDKALRSLKLRNARYRKACYIYTLRFFRVNEYLRNTSRQFERVIMADARDVMFQGDPFAQITDLQGVYAFTEFQHLHDDPKFNQVWARHCYGEEWVKSMMNEKIICAGVVMGGMDGMLKYLDAFETEFEKVGACHCSTDTAIHNRLLRKVLPKEMVHIEASENASSIHLPLVREWQGRISIANGIVSNSKGEPYQLVHLADRNKQLFTNYSRYWA